MANGARTGATALSHGTGYMQFYNYCIHNISGLEKLYLKLKP